MKFPVLAVLGLVAAACVTETLAKPTFVALVPGASNVKGVAAIGHINPQGGGEGNAFGGGFYKAGFKWTVDLCYEDSDTDGQFNGAELGDPCCEWVKDTNEVLAYKTASAPGDAKSTNDPKLWKSLKCANGEDPETKYKAHVAKAGAAGNGTAAANSTSTLAPTAGSSGASAPNKSSTVPTPAPSHAVSITISVAAAAVGAVAASATMLF